MTTLICTHCSSLFEIEEDLSEEEHAWYMDHCVLSCDRCKKKATLFTDDEFRKMIRSTPNNKLTNNKRKNDI